MCQTPALSDANNEEKQQESNIGRQEESDSSTAVNTSGDSLIDDGEGRNEVDNNMNSKRTHSSIVHVGNSFDENYDADFEFVDKTEALDPPIAIHRERSRKDSEIPGPGCTSTPCQVYNNVLLICFQIVMLGIMKVLDLFMHQGRQYGLEGGRDFPLTKDHKIQTLLLDTLACI